MSYSWFLPYPITASSTSKSLGFLNKKGDYLFGLVIKITRISPSFEIGHPLGHSKLKQIGCFVPAVLSGPAPSQSAQPCIRQNPVPVLRHLPFPLDFLHWVLVVVLERTYTELTIFPEPEESEKEKSKSEIVKKLGVSLSIFCTCLENWDKIRKAAKGSEVGSRTKGEQLAHVGNWLLEWRCQIREDHIFVSGSCLSRCV